MVIFKSVRVAGYRSIADSGVLPLGDITLLIGRNNSGKSALLRAIYLLQSGSGFDPAGDPRLRSPDMRVDVDLAHPRPESINRLLQADARLRDDVQLYVGWNRTRSTLQVTFGFDNKAPLAQNNISQLSSQRPDHLLVPVLARRKAMRYGHQVQTGYAQSVESTDNNLTSRIAALTSGEHPEGRLYRTLLERVLGVRVATYLTEQGQQPGLPISSAEGISLERMGEGISSALTMLSELASPGARAFLIEEPENDLHPKALRALLDVILENADSHQFLVSTHSDVVLRHLGSHPEALVYRTQLVDGETLPTSTYVQLNDQLDRLDALNELGYETVVPTAWLILEESSAERIIREVLIPLFVPRLACVQTVGGRGAGDIPATATDLHRMTVFARLIDQNVPRAWVLVDGDQAGEQALARLRAGFKSWPESRFEKLTQPVFENYYPDRFTEDVKAALAIEDRRERMRHKGALAEQVSRWAFNDQEAARAEFAVSAREVIDHLTRIEAELSAIAM